MPNCEEWGKLQIFEKIPPWCILFDYSPTIRYKKLQENTEVLRIAYTVQITFIVSIGKEVTRINNNGEEITKHLSYRLRFINSARSMYELWQTHYQILSIIILCSYGINVRLF